MSLHNTILYVHDGDIKCWMHDENRIFHFIRNCVFGNNWHVAFGIVVKRIHILVRMCYCSLELEVDVRLKFPTCVVAKVVYVIILHLGNLWGY